VATRTYSIIGAPSAAGAHSPGVEKAPQALRSAGLADALRRRGVTVDDSHGDMALVPFSMDRDHRYAQNVAGVARVARALAGEVESVVAGGDVPLVLGGDCTILLGVLAGRVRRQASTGLVYLDAHPDLNTPETVVQGALDWMGMAHVLAEESAVEELTALGPRTPLLSWDDVTFFGVVESELSGGERRLVSAHPERFVLAADIAGRAGAAAASVAAEVAGAHAGFIVHFDVDVLDFVDFPIADNAYQRNQGLTLDDALTALRVFAGSPAFAGLVITEVNPDHAPSRDILDEFVEGLASALASPF
jgi:arginase